ncbi:MAG: phenylalanine--tRNA ligase subunit beta [Fimbriimonadaceae bacterium]
MKFPYAMLRDFVETDLDAHQIGDLLTMAGFELEGIEESEGDHVLDIKVVANRGDGLSVFGLAREVLAKDPAAKPTDLYRQAVARFPMPDLADPDASRRTSVSIETDDCGRYACRLFESVRNGDAPEWVRKRLRQAGQRPISLIVDLTNYVMLELGQPLHAFDMEKLAEGRIVVRHARPGERLTTLNGIEHELQPGQMMICDASEPVAVAGVMGGESSEVSADTKTVLLESAHFDARSVRRTRKQLGLGTDASYRFERSVDPDGVVAALNRFAQLLSEVPGAANVVPGVVDVYPKRPTVKTVSVRVSRTNALLGMPVTASECQAYLERLGFGVEGDGEPFVCTVPTWRPDVEIEDDLVEEVGRVHGYDRIPSTPIVGTSTPGGVFGIDAFRDAVVETMLRCGFTQIVSHSLGSAHPLDFDAARRVTLRNPLAPDFANLRDSTLPGLADAARRNGSRDLHLFEVGHVFVKGEVQIDESWELGILTTGALHAPHWTGPASAEADFYSLKGVIEEVARRTGLPISFGLPRNPDRRLHPTRQAGVLVDGGRLWAGTFGQIHPEIADELGLPAQTCIAELDLHDIAVVVEKRVPFAEIESAIRQACGDSLEKLWMLSVYEGKGIPDGSHSIAVALQLRKMGENFTDEEANQVRDRAVAALVAVGATPR